MKNALSVGLLLSVSLCRGADFKQVEAIYQSILSSNDDSSIPSVKELRSQGMEDSIKALTSAEIQALLPLAKQCWQSPRKGVRTEGLSLMLGISLRPDSTKLLEPYLDDLATLLTSPEESVRKPVVYLLGATNPTASPKAPRLPCRPSRRQEQLRGRVWHDCGRNPSPSPSRSRDGSSGVGGRTAASRV